MAKTYKVAVGLIITGIVTIVGSIAIFAAAPVVKFQDSVCEVTCATYINSRTAPDAVFYPLLVAGIVLFGAGALIAFGKSLSDV